MIERNEAPVLPRSLGSFKALKGIDPVYCIVDGGSKDGSSSTILETMGEIPGEVHLIPQPEPLDDFAAARNGAIERAQPLAEWLFFLDADDEIQTAPGFVMPDLEGDAYKILIKFGDQEYSRLALVRSGLPWAYNGRVHENLECKAPFREKPLDGIWIRVHPGEGARGRDPKQKFLNDAAVLRQCLAEDPGNTRHMFYLAQSVRDSGDLAGALDLYEKRAKMGGWDEETFFSLLSVARIKVWLNYPPLEVTEAFIRAHRFRPSRAEALGFLAEYLRKREQWQQATYFASMAANTPRPADILFVEAPWFEWRAKDELAISSFYAGDLVTSRRAAQELLTSGKVPPAHLERVKQNLAFAEAALGG
jgi:glycosyltransferase involved in cell wall biosynthesis